MPDTPGEMTQLHSPDPDAEGGSAGRADSAAPPDLSFLSPPTDPGDLGRLGPYRVRRLIGVGGMGMVFEALDTHLLRPVALKVMRPEFTASFDARTRFLKEARAAAALSSDHIVTVFQVGQDNDVPFMAMQLLQGEPLDARLAREPRLPVIDALTIAIQAAAGLAAAHAAGMIHRDIKPSNLWLETKADEKTAAGSGSDSALRALAAALRVKILDLGLVRRGDGPQLTAAGMMVGTPHFMAPEQAEGVDIDHRADLFSLGCVIYTMLSGELAFPGPTTMAVLMALANRTPTPLTALNPEVPAELSALVARMMAKTPGDRPGSAAEVIGELDAILVAEMDRRPRGAAPSGRASGVLGRPARRETSPAPAAPTPSPSALPTLPPMPGATPPAAAPPGPPPAWRRGQVIGIGAGLVALSVGLVVYGLLMSGKRTENPPAAAPPGSQEPIKVGVLHSQSGTMALSESPVIDATLLAIDELNRAGGVLGRPVQPVVVDGKSDPDVFATAAENLLGEEKVAAVFGCWTSASRKAVRPVFERYAGLLFYPVQYEGLEQSPRIVYTGPAPNQQLLPAIDYLTGTLGKKRLFVVGSDYVFPRTAHAIITDRVRQLPGVEVVGTAFLPLGSRDVAGAVKAVREANPDAIVNTLNGTTNNFFFKELRSAGFTAEKIPTLSVSIAENELRGLDPAVMAGGYLAASYFQTVDREEGRAFVRKIRERYGADRVASDAMAAAYAGVHLWAQAAAAAGKADPDAVVAKVRGASFAGPGGMIRIDPENQHAWQPWRIGKVRADGSVDVVAGTNDSIAPNPFPNTRTRAEWERFLNELYVGWNGRWQAPANP
jgi:urea transport system substrate-binding protein